MQEYAEEKTTKAATKKKKRIRQSWRRRRMSRNGRGEKRRIANLLSHILWEIVPWKSDK